MSRRACLNSCTSTNFSPSTPPMNHLCCDVTQRDGYVILHYISLYFPQFFQQIFQIREQGRNTFSSKYSIEPTLYVIQGPSETCFYPRAHPEWMPLSLHWDISRDLPSCVCVDTVYMKFVKDFTCIRRLKNIPLAVGPTDQHRLQQICEGCHLNTNTLKARSNGFNKMLQHVFNTSLKQMSGAFEQVIQHC